MEMQKSKPLRHWIDVNDKEDVDALVRFLLSEPPSRKRRMPAVCIMTAESAPSISPDRVRRVVGGGASVYVVSPSLRRMLNAKLPEGLHLEPESARFCWPDVPGCQHPLVKAGIRPVARLHEAWNDRPELRSA